MFADLLFINIEKLYTPFHKPPVKGQLMRDILTLEHCSMAVKDGLILDISTKDLSSMIDTHTLVIDSSRCIIVPGFVDSHTHLVHYGSREKEALQLAQGVPYLEILKQGGGILSTVRETRNATHKELYQKAYTTLNNMLSFGVTTLEAKSGYGLNQETEMKQLAVTKELNKKHPIELFSTYLGAHAIPPEFKDNREGYIELILQSLSIVKQENLADAVDVFMETSVFDYDETKRILTEAKRLGLKLHLHADEITSLGGAGLGIEMGAASVDHLMAITDNDIALLKDSNTIANLLPATSFFLNKAYAPARKLIDNGVAVSISSDYNPGSAPSENYQFALQLAFNKMKMLPSEIITASSINPAFHLGCSEIVGSLEKGKQADLILMEAPSFEYALIHFAVNPVKQVYKKGKLVYNKTNQE